MATKAEAKDKKAEIIKKRQELEAKLRELNEREVDNQFDLINFKNLFVDLKPEQMVDDKKKQLGEWEFLLHIIKKTFNITDNLAILKTIGKKMGIKSFDVVAVKKAEPAPRKTYDDAFKAKALKMVKDGKTKAEVCKELDITPSSLANWIKAAAKK